jgi:TBC1 domain family member 2
MRQHNGYAGFCLESIAEFLIRSEPRTDIVCLGNSTSRKWLRAGHQRSSNTVFSGIPVCLYRCSDALISFLDLSLTGTEDSDPETFDPAALPKEVMDSVEADSFWCLSRLLDGIQDNYIHTQPGIQRSVRRMTDLVARIDGETSHTDASFHETDFALILAPLAAHLESQNVEFMQFAFRWMNCLLMREISVKNTIRMWDTYLVTDTSNSSF